MYRFEIKDQGRRQMISYPKREAVNIASQLGLDFEIDREHRWFLNQVLQSILPLGWKKEYDPFGYLQFHNAHTNVTTEKHPFIYKFRKAFALLSSQHSQDLNVKGIENTPYENQQIVFRKLLHKVQDGTEQPRDSDTDSFYRLFLEDSKTAPPSHVQESLEYQLIDPLTVLEKAIELNLQEKFRFFWVARMLPVLPLPPNWSSEDHGGQKLYINPKTGKPQAQHPAIQFLRSFVASVGQEDSDRQPVLMDFHDKDFIKYSVDLRNLANGFDYIVSRDRTPNALLKRKAFEEGNKASIEEALDNIMIFELAVSLGINLENEVHMIGGIYHFIEYLKSVSAYKDWEFRFTAEKKRYWYNKRTSQARSELPFRKLAVEYLRRFRQETLNRTQDLIKAYAKRHPFFELNHKQFFEAVRSEAINLVKLRIEMFLEDGESPLQIEVPEFIRQEFLHKENIHEDFSVLSTENVLNLLFANPFVLDSHEHFQNHCDFMDLLSAEEVAELIEKSEADERSIVRYNSFVDDQFNHIDYSHPQLARSRSIANSFLDEGENGDELGTHRFDLNSPDHLKLGTSPMNKYKQINQQIHREIKADMTEAASKLLNSEAENSHFFSHLSSIRDKMLSEKNKIFYTKDEKAEAHNAAVKQKRGVYVNEEGYLVNADGSYCYDKDGNLIKGEQGIIDFMKEHLPEHLKGVYINEEGYLVNADGSYCLDKNGNRVKGQENILNFMKEQLQEVPVKKGVFINEEGYLVNADGSYCYDKDGNLIRGEEGIMNFMKEHIQEHLRGVYINEEGYLVNADGSYVYDKDGNLVKGYENIMKFINEHVNDPKYMVPDESTKKKACVNLSDLPKELLESEAFIKFKNAILASGDYKDLSSIPVELLEEFLRNNKDLFTEEELKAIYNAIRAAKKKAGETDDLEDSSMNKTAQSKKSPHGIKRHIDDQSELYQALQQAFQITNYKDDDRKKKQKNNRRSILLIPNSKDMKQALLFRNNKKKTKNADLKFTINKFGEEGELKSISEEPKKTNNRNAKKSMNPKDRHNGLHLGKKDAKRPNRKAKLSIDFNQSKKTGTDNSLTNKYSRRNSKSNRMGKNNLDSSAVKITENTDQAGLNDFTSDNEGISKSFDLDNQNTFDDRENTQEHNADDPSKLEGYSGTVDASTLELRPVKEESDEKAPETEGQDQRKKTVKEIKVQFSHDNPTKSNNESRSSKELKPENLPGKMTKNTKSADNLESFSIENSNKTLNKTQDLKDSKRGSILEASSQKIITGHTFKKQKTKRKSKICTERELKEAINMGSIKPKRDSKVEEAIELRETQYEAEENSDRADDSPKHKHDDSPKHKPDDSPKHKPDDSLKHKPDDSSKQKKESKNLVQSSVFNHNFKHKNENIAEMKVHSFQKDINENNNKNSSKNPTKNVKKNADKNTINQQDKKEKDKLERSINNNIDKKVPIKLSDYTKNNITQNSKEKSQEKKEEIPEPETVVQENTEQPQEKEKGKQKQKQKETGQAETIFIYQNEQNKKNDNSNSFKTIDNSKVLHVNRMSFSMLGTLDLRSSIPMNKNGKKLDNRLYNTDQFKSNRPELSPISIKSSRNANQPSLAIGKQSSSQKDLNSTPRVFSYNFSNSHLKLDDKNFFQNTNSPLAVSSLSKKADQFFAEHSQDEKEMEVFNYFCETIGQPYVDFDVKAFGGHNIDPKLLILLGVRLGIKVSYEKYKSDESDLLWIPYLQLVTKHPELSFPNPIVLSKLSIGEHPGDYYFIILLSYQRKRRGLILNKLNTSERLGYLKNKSWLKFKSKKHGYYYYNFMTHSYSI